MLLYPWLKKQPPSLDHCGVNFARVGRVPKEIVRHNSPDPQTSHQTRCASRVSSTKTSYPIRQPSAHRTSFFDPAVRSRHLSSFFRIFVRALKAFSRGARGGEPRTMPRRHLARGGWTLDYRPRLKVERNELRVSAQKNEMSRYERSCLVNFLAAPDWFFCIFQPLLFASNNNNNNIIVLKKSIRTHYALHVY